MKAARKLLDIMLNDKNERVQLAIRSLSVEVKLANGKRFKAFIRMLPPAVNRRIQGLVVKVVGDVVVLKWRTYMLL